MVEVKNNLVRVGLALAAAAVMLPAHAATVDVDAEATIRSGANADTDQNEASAGYVHVNFNSDATGNFVRKGYFQFDLSGQNADLNKAATFSFTLQASESQAIQLWALDQAYAGFNSSITWNTAQANDTASLDLLTDGDFTATRIGDIVGVPGTNVGDVVEIDIDSLAPFIFDDKITFALTSADPTGTGVTNSSAGLRIRRGTSGTPAQLTFDVVPEPSSLALLALGGLAVLRRRRG